MITDYKYRSFRTQFMGCCFSDPEEDDIPNQNQEKSHEPIKIQASHLGESPSKLAEQDGESLRQKGNEHFKRKEFAQAIEAYKRAISLPNPNAAYYSNLALAYKANGQYEESIQTVDQLIRRPTLRIYQHSEFFRKAQIVKARCIIIQVRDYCLSGDYSELQSREKVGLIKGALGMLEEITAVPNSSQQVQGYLQSGGKILQFLQEEVVPRSKHQSLLHYLKAKFQKSQLQGAILEYYSSGGDLIEEIEGLVQGEMQLALQQPEDFIVDPITYDIFISPVIVPSGQTYDEAILKQHFKNNGYNDPITHEIYRLGETVIVRNLTLQAYITEIRRSVHKTDLDYLKY